MQALSQLSYTPQFRERGRIIWTGPILVNTCPAICWPQIDLSGFPADELSDFPTPGGCCGPAQPPSCWAVDFGLDALNQRDFWAIEAVPGFAWLACDQRKSLWDKLMSSFQQAVLRSRIQHTLSAQHDLVLAIGGSWHGDISQLSLIHI